MTFLGYIDHSGPGLLDEVLVEFVASGEERVVPRDALSPLSDLVQGVRATGESISSAGASTRPRPYATTATRYMPTLP